MPGAADTASQLAATIPKRIKTTTKGELLANTDRERARSRRASLHHMTIKRRATSHAYVGALSVTASLLAPVFLASLVSALAARGAVVHSGSDYRPHGAPWWHSPRPDVARRRVGRCASRGLGGGVLHRGAGYEVGGSSAVRHLQRLLAGAGYPPTRPPPRAHPIPACSSRPRVTWPAPRRPTGTRHDAGERATLIGATGGNLVNSNYGRGR